MKPIHSHQSADSAPRRKRRTASALRELLSSGAGGGLALMAAAALALIIANSPLASAYFAGLHVALGPLDLLHWINDGLMAVFFLFVALEVKREFLDGQLSTWSNRALPCIAAAGGVVVPGLVYVAFNLSNPEALRGWAVPTATDIAFALGVLALLGKRVPPSLKLFLATLAIVDDLIAVLVIALFYSQGLNLLALTGAVAVIGLLIALSLFKGQRLVPYLVLGAVLWVLVLLSGIHATIAGVVLALTIPIRCARGRPDDPHSPLHRLEHGLAPWVTWLIVPVFGFANAGVRLIGMEPGVLFQAMPLGIALGLVIGKQIGVFSAAWLTIRLRLGTLPTGATWLQLYGVSVLCGVGFTMSLFIGLLAFSAPAAQDHVKIGVLAGSLASAIAGATILRLAGRKRRPPPLSEADALSFKSE